MTMQHDATSPQVALNPGVDVTDLRERFEKTGRPQLREAFHPDTAGRLFTCLSEETPWMLAYNDGHTPTYLTREQMSAMSPEQQGAFMQQIFSNAADNFQYVYLDFPISGTANVPNQRKFYTHDVLRYMNGNEFQNLIKAITGLEGQFLVDSHATCFQAGHFLTAHTDLAGEEDPRELAYVINMTPNWRGDWGAATVFYDDDRNIVESFVPIFNSISLFKIPQLHAVSFVPPFCTQKRFGMTGWFYRPEDK